MCQKSPERRKVGDTLTATVEPSDAKVTYQWLADGKEISGATKATLEVTKDFLGKKISVEVTDGDDVAVSDETKAVTEDKAGEVSIFDEDGLQSDGTGLVNDTLRLSYGSEMGNPRTITWYYNETATSAYTSQEGNLTNALTLQTGVNSQNKNREGKYYAMIVNEAGQTFISNTIELVYDELPAEIASMDVEDDYEGDMNITYDAKDYTAVITVNMKKLYGGKFYIYEDSVVNYNSGNYTTMLDTDAVNFVLASTADKMTAKNVLNANFQGTTTTGAPATNRNQALAYIAPNGETTLMWAVKDTDGGNKDFLTRGKSYKLAFDQKEIETDNITAASRKDIETTDSVEAPYVVAPDSIVLETAANGQKAVVNFVDADGEKLAWLGGSNSAWAAADTNCGLESVTVYGNSEAKTDGAERATVGGTIVKGVWTSDGAIAKDKTIYYAVAKTEAGVFAEKSETLQSNYKTKNLPLASKLEVSDDGAKAKVTMNDVIAPSKVYVFNEAEAALAGGFDPDDSSSYRGYAEVSVGQGSAEVANVFKKDEIGDTYAAVLVPNDESAYARYASEAMTLKNKPTTLEYKADATMTETGTANGTYATDLDSKFSDTFESTTLVVKNQFGDVIENADNLSAISNKAATVAAANAGGKFTEKGGATFSYNGTKLTINLASNSNVDNGDGFDITVLGTKIEFRAAYEPTANAQKPFNAKIGSDTIMSATEVATPANVSQLNYALTKGNVTIANVATLGSGSVTIPEGKELKVAGTNANLSITNNGTMELTAQTELKGYTAPAKSTSAVTGAFALTIDNALTIGDGATMTVAEDLTLGAGATVTNNGTLAVAKKLTTAATAQNIALATSVDISTASGTKDAPTTLTAGAPKTTFGAGSTIADFGTMNAGDTAAITTAPFGLYAFEWPEGQTVASKWDRAYPGDAALTTATRAFAQAGDTHVQLASTGKTMEYAYSAKGDNSDTVFFNITY